MVAELINEMQKLKTTAYLFSVISIAAFLWVAWFLISTPASSFDTQGPGLVGAIVLFFAQVSGIFGIILFAVWIGFSVYRGSWSRPDQLNRTEKKQ